MKKSYVIIIAVIIIGVAAAAAYTVVHQPTAPTMPSAGDTKPQRPTPASQSQSTTPQQAAPAATPQQQAAMPAGFYGDYSNERAVNRTYDKTILFFHAPWCSECRAFEKAIQASTVPAGVQILKVDYDSRQDLRQKYGVRIQSTFVELDDDDDQDNDHDVWVGYGKDKSIDAILRNL